MDSTLAIWLGLFLLVVFGIDWFFYDWAFSVILMKKLSDLIRFMAFWR